MLTVNLFLGKRQKKYCSLECRNEGYRNLMSKNPHLKNKGGIYKITGPNGIYIGETTNFVKRFTHHQRSYEIAANLAGIQSEFMYEVLVALPKNIDKETMRSIETNWIDHFCQLSNVVNKKKV